MKKAFGEVIPFTPSLAQQLEDLKEGRPWYGDGVAVKLYSLQMSKDPEMECTGDLEFCGKRVWMTGEYRVLSSSEVAKLKQEWDQRLTP